MRYAPLCIFSFRLIAPRKIVEAQTFNQKYYKYEEIKNIQDRLRWLRHNMGLLQKDVADSIGITRSTYSIYECGHVDYYPKCFVEGIVKLYGIAPEQFLDEYNIFILSGQGRLLREYRKSLGLTQKEFALVKDVALGNLKKWEKDYVRMTKTTWEKIFKE